MKKSSMNLTGQKIGNWIVNEIGDKKGNFQYWKCTCTLCGKSREIDVYSLLSGKSTMCRSCASKMHPEITKKATDASRKSGLSKTKLYYILDNIHKRCEDPSTWNYKRYGGRGIKVCDEWSMKNVKSFCTWAYANGYKEGLQIDRIDNNGDYCPSNCRFVTPKDNARNRRSNHMVTVFGETITLAEAVEKYSNLPYSLVLQRMRRDGMPVEVALTRERSF